MRPKIPCTVVSDSASLRREEGEEEVEDLSENEEIKSVCEVGGKEICE